MKKIFSFALLCSLLMVQLSACAQDDKAQRPSPPAKVTQTISSGATISIDYSQPAVKGRTIGTDLEPMEGQVWRTGANEATVFETDKDVMIEGKALPAGKYALFTITNGEQTTIIFNKVWKTWGAYDYPKNKDQDALQVTVESYEASTFFERMTFTISEAGTVSLMWGEYQLDFKVQ